MGKTIIIIGASGRGKVVADIAKKNGYERLVFLDDDSSKTSIGGYLVEGGTEQLTPLLQENSECDVFVAIGNNQVRRSLMDRMEKKCAVLIHPSAVIDETAVIGAGSVVMAGAVINADARIGEGCIVNTGATIDHDCVIGDYSHISPGVHLAGTVQVGAGCWLGIGSAVANNIAIVDGCVIGAGGVVIGNINEPGTYVGCPVRKVSSGAAEAAAGGAE